jgi:uncharacterized protein (TIGR01777 family)
MKVIITGVTGLIGKEVGKILVQRGHEVIAVTRSSEKAKDELPFPATLVEWKGGSDPFPVQAMEAADAVINLMGENLSDHRWSDEVKKRLYESRVFSTRSLVSASSQCKKLKVWVQGSAIGFYGEAEKDETFDEFSTKGEGFLADLCEDWESEMDALSPQIRRVIIRTGVVFSHKGGAFVQMVTPFMNGVGGVLGSGKQQMSLIHLDDIAHFIAQSVENEKVQGAYNLVSTEPRSQKEIAEKLACNLQVKMGPSAPAFALKIMLGEMAETILENQPVFSKRMKETGYELKYPTIDDIINEVSTWHQNPLDPSQSTFVFYAEQFIPHPIEKVFAFFSDAQNLGKITPSFLNFKIEKTTSEKIEKNTQISYSLQVHGVPIHWLTDITEWQPPYSFVDNQLKGPYSLWYHHHRFDEVEGGTLMMDWIRYRLPLGKVGQWVGLAKIKSDVSEIFQYRRKVISGLIS